MLQLHETFSLLCATAIPFGIFFERKLSLQPTIALLLTSSLLTLLISFSPPAESSSLSNLMIEIRNLHFETIFMSYMLGLMLYAGSIHINSQQVMKDRTVICTLSLIGTIFSILLVGTGLHLASTYVFSTPLDWLDCFIFGAVISPTDPIAVLGLLKELKAPKDLSTLIAGESLFNDGVGIVAFNVLCATKLGLISPTIFQISLTFVKMAIGGISMGYVAYLLTKHLCKNLMINQKIMASIMFTICGYEASEMLHISAALFTVTFGLLSSHLLAQATPTERGQFKSFWEVIDEFMNLILFMMIGLMFIQININDITVSQLLISIAIVVVARACSVFTCLAGTRKKAISSGLAPLVTWSGLRGGLAIALALSSPKTDITTYNLILTLTYVNVLFSIILQGVSSKPLLIWYLRKNNE